MENGHSVFDAAGLQGACQEAVLLGRQLAQQIGASIEELATRLKATGLEPAEDIRDEATRAVLAADIAGLQELLAVLEEAARQQREDGWTVNMVLFGRTNIGKSTLITALTREAGTEVSRGTSDCTKRAEPRIHGWLAVVDTPGIGGPGLDVATQVLEERAAAALSTADVVLLCLDTMNLTDATIHAVAHLVAAHGKPLVVVMNARNPKWGRHGSVTDPAERRRLSREVAHYTEHARHRLAQVGLVQVPIVVVQSQLAMYARAAEPYAGPFPQTRGSVLTEAGTPELLLSWSNLPALEQLLTQILRGGATRLRHQARVNQLLGVVRTAGTHSSARTQQVQGLLEQHEAGIERVLELVGSPRTLAQLTRSGPDLRPVQEQLEQLEGLRKAPLNVRARGSAQDLLESLVTAQLSALRVHALQRADDVIDEALRTRSDIAPEEFHRRVVVPEEVDAAVEEIRDAFLVHVQEGLSLIAAEVRQDVRTQMAGAHVQARPGRGLYRTGMALGVASPVSTAAGTAILLSTGLSQAWNPVGWALLGTGLALSLVGHRMRKRAEARRTEQLSAARGAARRAVNDYVDQLGNDLTSTLMAACAQALVDGLLPTVDAAVAMHQLLGVQEKREHLLTDFEAEGKGLAMDPEDHADPQRVLAQAVRRCEEDLELLDDPSRRAYWWGEAWCGTPTDTPTGAAAANGSQGSAAGDLPARPDVSSTVEAFLAVLDRRCGPGTQQWLATAHQRLAGDWEARHLVADLESLARQPAIRTVICGDYNTGKSAFVARLHRELGIQVPDTLRSGVGVTTRYRELFRWGPHLLVDTPGFQSGQEHHRDRARAELRDATMTIYLFNPTGITGDLSDVLGVLMPGQGWGPVTAATTLFVVNRVENLGLDPHDSAAEFLELTRLKEAELARTLARNLDVDPQHLHVISVASAPYGDPLGRQPWDGMAEVAHLLAGQELPTPQRAAALSVVRGGVARLVELAARIEQSTADQRRRRERLARLREVLERSVRQERALVEEHTQRLVREVDEVLADILDIALTHPGPDQRAAAMDRLAVINDDPQLAEVVRHWQTASATVSAQLRQQVDDDVARYRVLAGTSPHRASDPRALAAARPSAILRLRDVRQAAKRQFRTVRGILNQVGAPMGLLGGAGRLVERAPLAARGLRAGGALLGAATVVIDVAFLVHEVRTGKQTAAARTALFHEVRHQGIAWATETAQASDPLWRLERHTGQLEILLEETSQNLASLDEHLRSAGRRLATYSGLIDDAMTILREDPDDDAPAD